MPVFYLYNIDSMEQTVELMLKENIIDKEALLMRKYDLIGLTREEALLILNVINLEKNNSKITVNSIQKTFSYKKVELEEILANLIDKDFINIKITKQGLEFNLKSLWKRLMKTYIAPDDNATADELGQYIQRMLDIKLTPSNKRDLETWVKQKGQKRIISIIEGIFRFNPKEVTFKNIKDIYESEDKTKRAKVKELENIIKFDWVSK